MRNFRSLEIWKRAIALSRDVYLLTKNFPESEKYGLSMQIRRAVVSIASNIAEGSARSSQTDFARYLEIALGSAFEVETQLEIAKLAGFIGDEECNNLISGIHVLQKQINQLITKIRKPAAKS
jgi:four helix bundle protein